MNLQLLEEIGLDKKEIKVYISLLELNNATTGPIVKESGVPSSHIYQVLQSLIDKGLTSYSVSKNVKHFQATAPERLYELIEERRKILSEKENELSLLMPILKQKQHERTKIEKIKQNVQLYEGIKGIKTALENVLNLLNKDDEFIVFGAPQIGNQRLHGFFNSFHKKRAINGIKYRIIYNADARSFGEERSTYPLTRVKFLPEGMNTPSVMWIYQDYVVHAVFTEEPIAIVIHNKGVAESSREYFNFMWKRSSK